MADLKFSENHNIAAFLTDPPAAHQESRFNKAILGQSLCQKNGANGEGTVESSIQFKEIIMSEQIIRDVLQIKDQPGLPNEIYVDQIKKILNRIGDEGVFLLQLKKMLPPYWHFLSQSFVICISGRKAGPDEISLLNTDTISALFMDLDFNFSRLVLNEMKNNLQGKRKGKNLMYPRFLQMIINAKYPKLKGRGETLDLKNKTLRNFGCFAEIDEDSKLDKDSNEEDEEVTVSDHDDDASPPVAIIAEEHVPLINVNDENDDNDDNDDDDDDDDDDDGINLEDNSLGLDDDWDDDEVEMDQGDVTPAITPSETDLHETQASQPLLKRKRLDPRPGVLIREQAQDIQQSVVVDTPTQPIYFDSHSMHEEPITVRSSFEVGSSLAPGGSSPPQPAHDAASERLSGFLVQQDIGPAPRGKGISIGAGSSEGVDPLISELKAKIGCNTPISVSSELRFDAEGKALKIIKKDVLIGNLDVRVFDLEKENLETSLQISALQLNHDALSAGYFDLKNKLISEFDDKFKTSSGETSVVKTL
ncbi:unnamed protein product [Lactuca saligna]|uniref:Uncharacterized protein n=1 Tax=Lactuca saligna TaxID=75948 RepID=A0AA36E0K3_LACSI|nr:unnamed protein product [Lactuca saligna]